MDRNQIRTLLESGVQQRIGSGMAAAWGQIDDPTTVQEVFVGMEGRPSIAGAHVKTIHPETYFDLASLTKVLATTSVAMVAYDRGRLALGESIDPGLTLGQLLSHTSGLPAWKPIYEKLIQRFGRHLPYASIRERKQLFLQEGLAIPPEFKPGEKVLYSDLGFWHLQNLLETRFQFPIDRLAQEWVWSALPGSRLHYRPVVMDSAGERYRIQQNGESVAMTEVCPWRGLLQGQVHDDNAWSLGGIAGHAGVFGRLSDVVNWVHGLFNESFVSSRTLSKFMSEVPEPDGARRAFGFDMTPLDGSGSTGHAFSPRSFGHLGFTGTSLWMDLDRGFFAILLSNRVHPDRNDTRIRAFRKLFYQSI